MAANIRKIYADPDLLTSLAGIGRWNALQARWHRMMLRRKLDGRLIVWWAHLTAGQKTRIETVSYGTLVLALAALL